MRLRLLTFLLLTACSSDLSEPKRLQDPPKPPEPKLVEKPAATKVTTPDTNPSTMLSQPTSTAGSMVVFVVDNQMAIPLACFDATTKAIHSAEGADASCATLVTTTNPIKLSNHINSRLKEKSEWTCEPAELKEVAFSIEPQLPIGSYTELAVYPPSAPVVFLPEVGEHKFTLNPVESALLAGAIKKSEPSAKKAPTIHQIVKLDIDGDGQEDTLFSVTVDGQGASDGKFESIEGKFGFGGLFIQYAKTPELLVLLRREDFSTLEVRGALDLNNDGRKEIIVSDTQWEGFGVVLYEVGVDGVLKTLGDWGCGA
jgi:hypothetical protein